MPDPTDAELAAGKVWLAIKRLNKALIAAHSAGVDVQIDYARGDRNYMPRVDVRFQSVKPIQAVWPSKDDVDA